MLAPRKRHQLPSGCESGSSSSKRRAEVDGAGNSESEARARGDSPGFWQLTSPSHPFSGMVPGTRMKRSALMMRSASLMNPFGKGVTLHQCPPGFPNGLPPRHKGAMIHSHMVNHPFESPKSEHVRKHPWTEGVSTLAGARKYRSGYQVWALKAHTSILHPKSGGTPKRGSQSCQRLTWGHKISSGPGGYIARAVWGVPNASEQGIKSEVAHKWAWWLHHPLPSRGANTSERGTKSEVAQKWAWGLHH